MTDNSSLEMLDDAINNPYARSDKWGERTIPLVHYKLIALKNCNRQLKEDEAVFRIEGNEIQNDGSICPKYQTVGHVKHTDYNLHKIEFCEGFDSSVLEEPLFVIEGRAEDNRRVNIPYVRKGDLVEYFSDDECIEGRVVGLSLRQGKACQLRVEIVGTCVIHVDDIDAFTLLECGEDILYSSNTSVKYIHFVEQAKPEM